MLKFINSPMRNEDEVIFKFLNEEELKEVKKFYRVTKFGNSSSYSYYRGKLDFYELKKIDYWTHPTKDKLRRF